MFNQILIIEKDQPYHIFMWRDGNPTAAERINLWLRVIFSDKPSPDLAAFGLIFLAEIHEIEYPDGAEVLK